MRHRYTRLSLRRQHYDNKDGTFRGIGDLVVIVKSPCRPLDRVETLGHCPQRLLLFARALKQLAFPRVCSRQPRIKNCMMNAALGTNVFCGMWSTRGMLAFPVIAGFASHILYFIRGEHHMNASLIFYAYIIIAIAIFVSQLQTGDQCFRSAVQNSLLYISAYSLALFTSISIYRVCFHRLRSFPGPFLARFSKLWHVYHVRHSLNHQLIQRLHEEYGPFVRTGKGNRTRILYCFL